MNLVQISNLANLITREHPFFNFYHFGWRSDVNMSLANNYDPGAEVGKLYPAVHFSAMVEGDTELGLSGGFDTYRVEVYFDDLLYYGNDAAYKNDTLLETWNRIKDNAQSWLLELKRIGKGVQLVIPNGVASFQMDGPNYQDRLATLRFSFTIRVPWACELLNLDIDPNTIPETPFPPTSEDYEKQTG